MIDRDDKLFPKEFHELEVRFLIDCMESARLDEMPIEHDLLSVNVEERILYNLANDPYGIDPDVIKKKVRALSLEQSHTIVLWIIGWWDGVRYVRSHIRGALSGPRPAERAKIGSETIV